MGMDERPLVGVDQHRHPRRLEGGPDGLQFGGVEIGARHVGADLHASHPGGCGDALQLAAGNNYRGFADGALFAWVRTAWRAVVPQNHFALIGLLVLFEVAVGVLVLLLVTAVTGWSAGVGSLVFFLFVCAQQVADIALTGDADRMVPAEHGERLAALLPHATLTVLPGAGHGDVTFGSVDRLLALFAG